MKKIIPLLLLLVLLTAGCDMTGITVTPTAEAPVINSFDADPLTIAAGESSKLIWSVSGATTISIDQGVGNVALSGTRAVVPSETTVYTLTATSASGMSTTATAQVIVSWVPEPPEPMPAESTPPPSADLPVINYFTTSPPVISGISGSTFLRWNVSGATAVSIEPGIGPVTSSGTMIVTLSSSTDFVLTASNDYGVVSRTARVLVGGASP